MITTTRRAESILPAHPHPQTALPAATLNFLGLPLVHPVAVAWMLIIRIDIRVTMREVVGDQERPDPNTKSSPMPPVKSKAVANRTKIVSTTIDKWLHVHQILLVHGPLVRRRVRMPSAANEGFVGSFEVPGIARRSHARSTSDGWTGSLSTECRVFGCRRTTTGRWVFAAPTRYSS